MAWERPSDEARFASKKQAEAFERGMSAPVLVARFETDPEDAPRGDGIYP